MIEAWIPVTISAALFQCWRTALQQRLKGTLGVEAAAFIRFAYGAPVAFLLLILLLARPGQHLPGWGTGFLLLSAGGGLLQIVATNLLIMAFGYRNFAVGTAYSKTEAPQAAVMAWLLLDETLRPLGWLGLLVALAGVMVLSLAASRLTARDLVENTLQPAALCGVGAVVTPGAGGGMAQVRCAYLSVSEVPLVLDLTEVWNSSPRDAAEAARRGVDPSDDLHATADYRRQLAATLTVRAVRAAIDEAGQRAVAQEGSRV